MALRGPSLARPVALVRVIALVALAGLAGCAGSLGEAANPPPADASGSAELARIADRYSATSARGNAGYKIGPQDVLDITVFKVADLSRSVQVADNGSINFPLIGEVVAAGKTSREIEQDLASRLGARYLQSPQVSVFVKEYNSQRATVEGAVKKPGVFPIRGRMTLLQMIAQAEGLDKETASSTVVVFRQTETGRAVARFDVDDIRAGRAEDPVIQKGDTIVVDSSSGKVAFGYFTRVIPVASLFKPF
jgi:polysaccharide export outer membrane protein